MQSIDASNSLFRLSIFSLKAFPEGDFSGGVSKVLKSLSHWWRTSSGSVIRTPSLLIAFFGIENFSFLPIFLMASQKGSGSEVLVCSRS